MPFQRPGNVPRSLRQIICPMALALSLLSPALLLAAGATGEARVPEVYEAGTPAPGRLPYQKATGTTGEAGTTTARSVRAGALPPVDGARGQYSDWLLDGPHGRGFAYYLAEGYRRLAKDEDNQHDFDDAARFLARAGAVERGEWMDPEVLQNRFLPVYAVDDLLYARYRLMAVLERGARSQQPKLAAYAQVMFDCWMEQQEENLQPQDVARCRREFEATVVRLEGSPAKAADPAIVPAQRGPAACPAICPPATAVYFEIGRAELDVPARASLANVAQTLKVSGIGGVLVSGHADRSGSDEFNMNLSRRRLESVVSALGALGVPSESIGKALYFGETRPQVPTADGVRMAENRRVELRYLCGPALPEKAVCPAPMPPLEAAAGTP